MRNYIYRKSFLGYSYKRRCRGMTNLAVAYAPLKGADKMQILPSYSEKKIGDTTYKVISIFAENGSLKDIYEKFIINSEKEMTTRNI